MVATTRHELVQYLLALRIEVKLYQLPYAVGGARGSHPPETHTKIRRGALPRGKFGFEGRFEGSSSENLFWHRTQRTENILVGGLVCVDTVTRDAYNMLHLVITSSVISSCTASDPWVP